MTIVTRALLLILALSVSGCGVVFRSANVIPGIDGSSQVRVVALTPETVAIANRSAYQPRTLPQIYANSGLATQSGTGVGTSTPVPPGPAVPQTRPGSLQLRLPPEADPGPYRIGVGDVVLLATRGSGTTVEELSGIIAAQNRRQGYTVQDDGSIAIPDIGRVRIAGLTLEQAEDVLFEVLLQNQIDPSFSLEVAEFNSRRVSVGGAVAQAGLVPITLTALYLQEALAAAGGITAQDLDYASVRIYRNGALYQIPLDDLYSQDGLQRIRLVDGDSVFVDTQYDFTQAQAYFEQQLQVAALRRADRQQRIAELRAEIAERRADRAEQREVFERRLELGAVERDYVYITGEVQTQARFELPFENHASLADALFAGGNGIDANTGDISQIYVLRGASDPREFGAVTVWHLDLRNAAMMTLAPRFELRPDDVIYVAAQPVTRWNRVIQQITPSLITTAANTAAASN